MITDMYITMLPVILGGIFNMLFTKTEYYKSHKSPIDQNLVLKDGKRLFGDNKTYIGFVSMMVFCCFSQIILGGILKITNQSVHNEFYLCHENTLAVNFVIGSLLGFSYMLFELPNSFIKRRFDVPAGKTVLSKRGVLFFIIDQIDSLVGVMLVLVFISKISLLKYLFYIFLGGITHISVNAILYSFKVRRNL